MTDAPKPESAEAEEAATPPAEATPPADAAHLELQDELDSIRATGEDLRG